MPDLNFQIERAEVMQFAVVPQLAFKLGVTNADPNERIHTVALRCQIQIESTRRRYTVLEQESLHDLFGEPERCGKTLKTFLWTHASVIIPAFQGSTKIDIPVPCTFDFNVAATKFFAGLEEGDVPLCVQFSGTVFYAKDDAPLQVVPIPWDKEVKFRLPVKVWKDLMEAYYPGTAWLCLERDVFQRLYEYKVEHGIPTWEQTLEGLLRGVEEGVKR
jgi:hypothetical protein